MLASALGGGRVDHRRLRGPTVAFPGDALVRHRAARDGLDRFAAVYGGVVDHPAHAAKTLLHELVPGASACGDGYLPELAEQCRDVVLPGYTAFGVADVRRAAAAVRDGFGRRVRLKDGAGTNGHGQVVIDDVADVAGALAAFPRLADDGVVVEPDLDRLSRLTVSFLDLGGCRDAAFVGEPLTVRTPARDRYAGIDLTGVRGGAADLAAVLDDGCAVDAVRWAERVHKGYAVLGADVGKGTYDVLWGVTPNGRRVSGVCDPSLRPTASTPAEVVALRALYGGRHGAPVRARMRCAFDGRPDARLTDPDLVIHTPHVTIAVALSS